MIVPETENVLVAGLQAPGTVVKPVMLQRIAQFVAPVEPVPEDDADMLVGKPEKLVINTIYHSPTTAPVIFTCSVAAVE